MFIVPTISTALLIVWMASLFYKLAFRLWEKLSLRTVLNEYIIRLVRKCQIGYLLLAFIAIPAKKIICMGPYMTVDLHIFESLGIRVLL